MSGAKNIYLVAQNPNNPTETISDLTITDSLTLTGTHPGSLLEINNTSMVVELLAGPANYVLIMDPNTNYPAWSNNINIDEVTTNALNINGTSNGDLLQIGTTHNVERVPIGSAGQVLTVNNAANGVEWSGITFTRYFCSGYFPNTISFPGIDAVYTMTFGGKTAYSMINSNGWSTDTNQLTYNGSTTQSFLITSTISVSTAQDSTSYYYITRFNGNELPGSRSYEEVNKQYTQLTSTCIAQLAPGANIDFALILITPSSGADILIIENNWSITQVS
jgi:hypothetical protein